MRACLQKREPKKLGRPVTFKGDPESSQLSDAEKKRIKRRIANRESARRVRQKRQVLMEELHCKVSLANAPKLPAIEDTCNPLLAGAAPCVRKVQTQHPARDGTRC